jgi:hypothetical protein
MTTHCCEWFSISAVYSYVALHQVFAPSTRLKTKCRHFTTGSLAFTMKTGSLVEINTSHRVVSAFYRKRKNFLNESFKDFFFLNNYHTKLPNTVFSRSHGSSGSIVSDFGVRSPTEAEDFSSSPCVQTGSGAHPASCPMGIEWVPGVLSPGVKRGRGVTLTVHPI